MYLTFTIISNCKSKIEKNTHKFKIKKCNLYLTTLKIISFQMETAPKYTLIVKHSEEFDSLLTSGKFKFKKISDGLYYLTTTYNCNYISNYLINLLNTKVFVLSEITGNNIMKFITEKEK